MNRKETRVLSHTFGIDEATGSAEIHLLTEGSFNDKIFNEYLTEQGIPSYYWKSAIRNKNGTVTVSYNYES